jgi:hypothetical protein
MKTYFIMFKILVPEIDDDRSFLPAKRQGNLTPVKIIARRRRTARKPQTPAGLSTRSAAVIRLENKLKNQVGGHC